MALRLGYRNLVTNPDVYGFIQKRVGPLLRRVRQDRILLEQRWLHFWKIFNVELDDQAYNGRSRVYISAGRNVIETWRIALKGGLFPFTDWFGVEAKHSFGLDGNAMAEEALQREQLQHMKIRDHIDPFLQQYLTYGTAILRHGYEVQEEMQRYYEEVNAGAGEDDEVTVIRKEKLTNDGDDDDDDALRFRTSKGQECQLVEKLVKVKDGPTCRTVDLFHFFVYPTTCTSVQEAELAFEDITTSITDIEAMAKKYMDPKYPEFGHIYDAIEELVYTDGGRIIADAQTAGSTGMLPIEYTYTEWIRREREGIKQDPNMVLFHDLDPGFVNRSEVFWRGEIPGAKDPDTGKEYGVIDWQIEMVNDFWPIRIHPNARYRKRRPWHAARLVKVVNEFYARGVVEPFASLQYMTNDLGNLTLDNVVNALNPIVLIDKEKVQNFDSLIYAPSAKWFMEDPANSVVFAQPSNVAQIGTATMNMLMGFIQDFGGANFAVQGTPAPKGRGRAQNTATGMAQLAQAGSSGFAAALMDLQDQLMVPILEANYEMQEQFMSERQLITLGGKDGIPLIEKKIGFEDVVGNYVFTWKGAQQIQERLTITQGLQGLVQMLAQVRTVDPDAAAAFKIKWAALAKRFIVDGLGLPWADEVIETPEDQRTIDPELELDVMACRRFVPVSPADDDDGHLAVEAPALNEPRFRNDPVCQQLLQEHVAAHQAAKQAKAQAAQMQMLMQMAQQAQGPGASNGAGGGLASPPTPGGPAGPADLAQAQGATLAGGAQPKAGI